MFWYILGAVILGAVALAKCGNWKAWHDRMSGPGRTATLHVTGECSFPTAGYAVELISSSIWTATATRTY